MQGVQATPDPGDILGNIEITSGFSDGAIVIVSALVQETVVARSTTQAALTLADIHCGRLFLSVPGKLCGKRGE